MTAPDRPGTPDSRTYSTPEAAGRAADPPCEHHWVSQHKPGHTLYWVRLCGFCGDPDWDDLDRQVAEAIAAAAPAPPSADPDDLAERWFDGTFEDCGLTVRAAAMDGFRAGWAARAAAAPAPAAPAEADPGRRPFKEYPGGFALEGRQSMQFLAPHPQAAPALRALLEEALFLRQNGEYAPGGRENWHDWDLKAERLLRGLPPAGQPGTEGQ